MESFKVLFQEWKNSHFISISMTLFSTQLILSTLSLLLYKIPIISELERTE